MKQVNFMICIAKAANWNWLSAHPHIMWPTSGTVILAVRCSAVLVLYITYPLVENPHRLQSSNCTKKCGKRIQFPGIFHGNGRRCRALECWSPFCKDHHTTCGSRDVRVWVGSVSEILQLLRQGRWTRPGRKFVLQGHVAANFSQARKRRKLRIQAFLRFPCVVCTPKYSITQDLYRYFESRLQFCPEDRQTDRHTHKHIDR